MCGNSYPNWVYRVSGCIDFRRWYVYMIISGKAADICKTMVFAEQDAWVRSMTRSIPWNHLPTALDPKDVWCIHIDKNIFHGSW